MRRRLTAALGSVALFACLGAAAAEHPNFVLHKVKRAANLDKVTLVVARELTASGLAFSESAAAGECVVYVYAPFLKAINTDQLAVVLAHELAHCELGHHRSHQASTSEAADLLKEMWHYEYEADARGIQIARKTYPDARTAFYELMSIVPKDLRHPSGVQRLRALNEGLREAPVAQLAEQRVTTPVE